MDMNITPEPASPPVAKKAARRSGERTQLTPKEWIDAATALLVDKSIDAVRVDLLAKILEVTRGSFYWHFTDRDDLLNRLLQSWRDDATEQVISRFERRNTSARELIGDLLSLPFRGRSASRASSIELAIRSWARRDDVARKAVDDVDAQRLSYIAQCFSSLGYEIGEARSRAFLLYSYELAESLVFSHNHLQQRNERRALIERLLLDTPG